MAQQAEHNINTITLLELTKEYMIDVQAPTNAMENYYFTWASRAVQELNYDVLRKFKRVYLVVDPATKTAKLPSDMVQYTRVALVNQVSELIDLAYNPNLVMDIEQPDCCQECGCPKEVCDAINLSEQTTVTLPSPEVLCDYSVRLQFAQYQGICPLKTLPYTITSVSYGSGKGMTTTFTPPYPINSAGDQVTFNNTYFIAGLGYTVAYGDGSLCTKSISYYNNFPLTVVSYKKNGTTVTDGTVCADLAALDAYMTTLGWTRTSGVIYETTSSSDVWSDFIISGASTLPQSVVVGNSNCSVDSPDIDYVNICKTCTDSSGNILKECCTYGNSQQLCTYAISLINDDGDSFALPLTDGVITINNNPISLGTITSFPNLISYMEGLGFTLTDLDTFTFVKESTSDVYSSFASAEQDLTFSFTQSLCIEPIEPVCTKENICKVEIAECGCPILTDETVNTMTNAGIVNNTMFERYIHGGEIGVTWRQPFNRYGFYNVDMNRGIIQFDPFYRFDTAVLEYIATDDVTSRDHLVPLICRDFILAYIRKCEVQRKNNVSLWQIEKAEKQCRAAKRVLMERLSPLRYAELKQVIDTTPLR